MLCLVVGCWWSGEARRVTCYRGLLVWNMEMERFLKVQCEVASCSVCRRLDVAAEWVGAPGGEWICNWWG